MASTDSEIESSTSSSDNEEEVEDIFMQAVTIYVAARLQKQQQRRRQNRRRRRHSRNGAAYLAELLNDTPSRMRDIFRFVPTTFMMMVHFLKQYGVVPESNSRTRVGVEKSLAIFLAVVSGNSSIRHVGELFGRSLSTVSKHFNMMSDSLCAIAPVVICPRNMDETPERIAGNERFMPWFKDVVGAIDGTLISGELPSKEQLAYRSRKGYLGQNVLCCCDFDMRITFISAGWEGSAHDSRVLGAAIATPEANFPWPPAGKYYLVDCGFKNTTGFLAPFRGSKYHLQDYRGSTRRPTTAIELFNHRHSCLRNVVERTFGAMKRRFEILKVGMRSYDPDVQTKIVIACAVLWNFLQEHQHEGDSSDDEVESGMSDAPGTFDDVNNPPQESFNNAADVAINQPREHICTTMWDKFQATEGRPLPLGTYVLLTALLFWFFQGLIPTRFLLL